MFYLFCIFKRQNMRNQKVLLRILFLQDSIRDAQKYFFAFLFLRRKQKIIIHQKLLFCKSSFKTSKQKWLTWQKSQSIPRRTTGYPSSLN